MYGIPMCIPAIQLRGWKMSTEAATEDINIVNGRIMAIQNTAAPVCHQNSCGEKKKNVMNFIWFIFHVYNVEHTLQVRDKIGNRHVKVLIAYGVTVCDLTFTMPFNFE